MILPPLIVDVTRPGTDDLISVATLRPNTPPPRQRRTQLSPALHEPPADHSIASAAVPPSDVGLPSTGPFSLRNEEFTLCPGLVVSIETTRWASVESATTVTTSESRLPTIRPASPVTVHDAADSVLLASLSGMPVLIPATAIERVSRSSGPGLGARSSPLRASMRRSRGAICSGTTSDAASDRARRGRGGVEDAFHQDSLTQAQRDLIDEVCAHYEGVTSAQMVATVQADGGAWARRYQSGCAVDRGPRISMQDLRDEIASRTRKAERPKAA